MFIGKNQSRLGVSVIIASMALYGCATPGKSGSIADGTFECNTLIAAGAGAVVGGLLGRGKNTVRGAAIGAGVAALACAALNYHSRQVKSAQQVESEYKAAHNGALPGRTTVIRYETKFQPSTVQPGAKAVLNSYIEVARGRNDPDPRIEEEATIYKPDGTPAKSLRKAVNEVPGAGAYSASFNIPMPEGVPEGVYPVRTMLYVNGQQEGSTEAKLHVVMVNGQTITRLVLNER